MNAEQLNAIKERAEKATPGPWVARGLNVLDYARVEVDINDYESKIVVKSTNNSDIKFIAHAREDIPQLVAEVERMQSLLSGAYETLESIGADDTESYAKLSAYFGEDEYE